MCLSLSCCRNCLCCYSMRLRVKWRKPSVSWNQNDHACLSWLHATSLGVAEYLTLQSEHSATRQSSLILLQSCNKESRQDIFLELCRCLFTACLPICLQVSCDCISGHGTHLCWSFYGGSLNADLSSSLALLAWDHLEGPSAHFLCQNLCSAGSSWFAMSDGTAYELDNTGCTELLDDRRAIMEHCRICDTRTTWYTGTHPCILPAH